MRVPGRNWLVAAAIMSFAASLLHLATIAGGAEWYRFLGAGEDMARLEEAGSWGPAILTFIIAVILAVWGLYAMSAAGSLRRLPLVRTALVTVIIVLSLRALQVFFPATWGPELGFTFMAVTSAIVAVMALTFAIGTARAWPSLEKVRP